MSATVLEGILASTRVELARRKRELPLEQLVQVGEHAAGGAARTGEAAHTGGRASGGAGAAAGVGVVSGEAPRPAGRFREALGGAAIAVIAEFKRRSPSAGQLRERPEIAEIVGAYARGGAAALSILTEGPNFEGSLDDLRRARGVSELPILRKDFIVDPYQLHEARVAGADAVLLIVAALEQPMLAALHEAAASIGLDVLVEVHDSEELSRARDIGAELIGVNNRDLRDFSVDVRRTSRLMSEVPAGVTVVSESGITSAEHVRELHEQGVRAVLVGESLMRAGDPEAAVRTLREFKDIEGKL